MTKRAHFLHVFTIVILLSGTEYLTPATRGPAPLPNLNEIFRAHETNSVIAGTEFCCTAGKILAARLIDHEVVRKSSTEGEKKKETDATSYLHGLEGLRLIFSACADACKLSRDKELGYASLFLTGVDLLTSPLLKDQKYKAKEVRGRMFFELLEEAAVLYCALVQTNSFKTMYQKKAVNGMAIMARLGQQEDSRIKSLGILTAMLYIMWHTALTFRGTQHDALFSRFHLLASLHQNTPFRMDSLMQDYQRLMRERLELPGLLPEEQQALRQALNWCQEQELLRAQREQESRTQLAQQRALLEERRQQLQQERERLQAASDHYFDQLQSETNPERRADRIQACERMIHDIDEVLAGRRSLSDVRLPEGLP